MRGLPTLGTASEISLRVSGYMNNPGGPPPTLPSRNSYVPLIFDVLFSLKAMVSRIMASNVSDESITGVDMHIKIFLPCFHRFDITLKNTHTEAKPKWLTSYNFVSLTNIPRILQQYGPVRNLWEGGGLGEKVIQLMKPSWFGFRKNWPLNMMNKLLKTMALGRIRNNDFSGDEEEDDDDQDTTDEAPSMNNNLQSLHTYTEAKMM